MAAWTNWLSKHCRSCGNLLPLRVTQLLITALCPQTFNLEKIDVTWKEMWNDSIHSKWFSKHHIGRNQGFKDRVCQFSASYFEILMTSVLRCCNNMNHSPRKKHDWTLHWSVTDWPANQQTHRFWTQTQWSYRSRMCVCVCVSGVSPPHPHTHTQRHEHTHACTHVQACTHKHTHTDVSTMLQVEIWDLSQQKHTRVWRSWRSWSLRPGLEWNHLCIIYPRLPIILCSCCYSWPSVLCTWTFSSPHHDH